MITEVIICVGGEADLGRILKWLFVGLLGMFALGSYMESTKTPEQKEAEARQRQLEQQRKSEELVTLAKAEEASLPSYKASDLAQAYEENTVAADAAFKDKKFKVSGVVQSINTDIFGNPYLVLRGGVNQFMEPQFSFDSDSTAQLSAIRKGMKVNLICTGRGDIAKIPMSGNCALL